MIDLITPIIEEEAGEIVAFSLDYFDDGQAYLVFEAEQEEKLYEKGVITGEPVLDLTGFVERALDAETSEPLIFVYEENRTGFIRLVIDYSIWDRVKDMLTSGG